MPDQVAPPAHDVGPSGAVTDALRALPLRQRQSVVLRDWAGFETSEVARILGTKESTVRVHLARGRASLREMLSVEERER